MKLTGKLLITLAAGTLLSYSPIREQTNGNPVPGASSRLNKPHLLESYSRLPLSFEANYGQTDSEVRFISRGSGYSLFLTPNEAVFNLGKSVARKDSKRFFAVKEVSNKKAEVTDRAAEDPTEKDPDTAFRMKLIGANSSAHVEGLDKLPGKVNYFIGNDPRRWQTNIPTYAKVRYQNVYPGVDLIYYGNNEQLEYDFVLSSGVDPCIIALQMAGISKMEVNPQGDLVLHTDHGQIKQRRPFAYQVLSGVKQEVQARYVLKNTYQVAFEVDSFDKTKPLTIDPALSYSTYLGGSGFDSGYGVAVDSAFNAYITGTTTSVDFPLTAGAFQSVFGGGGTEGDVFIAKLDPTGSSLVYSTFLGGNESERAQDIAVDSVGNAYITGDTASSNFPTANAVQSTKGGGRDAFVGKLNQTGSILIYSTFLGGTQYEEGRGIEVDPDGNVYLAGRTQSINFPVTPGAFQILSPSGGAEDAFVTKLNSTGAFAYSTYLGSSDGAFAMDIAVGSTGEAYVTGVTQAADFLTTPNAFQQTIQGDFDVFVTRFDSSGSSLIYSTYLGGSAYDDAKAISLDSIGFAYVTGRTYSPDLPVLNSAQASYAGQADAFIAKLNPNGSALAYLTYLGGSSFDEGRSIVVDNAGNAYVTGPSASNNFPTTFQALPGMTGDSGDAFVMKLNSTGAFVYSTYLGGASLDNGIDIAVDSAGFAYLTGETFSNNFPTASAWQSSLSGNSDVFVTKFDFGGTNIFYLHGSGSSNNPPTLFLDQTASTATTAKFRDSAAIKFSGGNLWKEIGTWGASPTQAAGTLTALGDLHLWLGLKSGGQGTNFDLRVEVYKNGMLVASGETYCIQGITTDPSLAKESTVSFSSLPPITFDGVSDVLSLKVLARIGSDGAGASCGGQKSAAGLRLYFDSVGRPSRFARAS